jgi:hypothetical protein
MHAVARDLRLLMGLRLAVDEHRPLPYATTLCAQRCGLRDPKQASRVLRALVRLGVIDHVGSLPARGKPDGTKLYAPPLQGAPVGVEVLDRPTVEPAGKVPAEHVMRGAVALERGAAHGVGAAGNSANRAALSLAAGRERIAHAPERTPAIGGAPEHEPPRTLTEGQLVERLEREFDAVDLGPDADLGDEINPPGEATA